MIPALSRRLLVGLAGLVLLALACSPEAARGRSSGPGADVWNRGGSLDVHGPINIFYETPNLGPPR